MGNKYFISFLILGLISCKTKISTKDTEDLPKDVALKPNRKNKSKDLKILEVQKSKIDSIIATVRCTNEDDWRLSPIGSKACGGPATYIAYPKVKENELLPLIKIYTEQSDLYKKKWHAFRLCDGTATFCIALRKWQSYSGQQY